MSSNAPSQDGRQQLRVAIIGAGISGLALANGLLNDGSQRFQVAVYERDQVAYELDRGGYQLRMAAGGIDALKACLDLDTWNELQRAWAGDDAKAPSMVDPKSMTVHLNLAEVKVYPKSRPIARTDLKRVLLAKPALHDVVKWGHSFDRYELVPAADGSDNHQVLIHFQDPEAQPSVYADLLIAADGSNSRINRQVGLNNKIKLKSWTLFQSRGPIDQGIFDKLPRSLLTQGSNLYLAGTSYSGFATVYQDSLLTTTAQEGRDFQLFWSALVPKPVGDSILERSGDDKRQMVRLLCEYVVDTLHYNVDGLPFLFENATDHIRTGAVTSSFQPTSDWRQEKAANARIIIMGDAMHPMTPGRGMGANQALMDAGKLSDLLRGAVLSPSSPLPSKVTGGGASDGELHRLVKTFDAEMYDRAFKMVKASEDMSGLDLTCTSGKVKIAIGKFVLTTIGYVVAALELLGLKQPQEIDFVHPSEKKAV